jgi:hypothetical protein
VTEVSKVASILVIPVPLRSLGTPRVKCLFRDRSTFGQLDVADQSSQARESRRTTRALEILLVSVVLMLKVSSSDISQGVSHSRGHGDVCGHPRS